jgi:hypothetical protein
MRGTVSPLPNTPSWCGAQITKHKNNFTLTFTNDLIGTAIKKMSSVSIQGVIVTRLLAGRSGFDLRQGQGFFYSPRRPYQLCVQAVKATN